MITEAYSEYNSDDKIYKDAKCVKCLLITAIVTLVIFTGSLCYGIAKYQNC